MTACCACVEPRRRRKYRPRAPKHASVGRELRRRYGAALPLDAVARWIEAHP